MSAQVLGFAGIALFLCVVALPGKELRLHRGAPEGREQAQLLVLAREPSVWLKVAGLICISVCAGVSLLEVLRPRHDGRTSAETRSNVPDDDETSRPRA